MGARVKSLKLTEAEFTRQVIDLAHARGWLVMHQRPARTSKGWRTAISGDIGFPDLVMVRDGRLVFAELKVGKNKMSAAQERWIEQLQSVRSVAGVRANSVMAVEWRPEDWDCIELFLE